MSHDHYKKDVRHLDMIDVYRVLELFNVTHPALQHAAKKILAAGNRGAKDWEKDVREAVDSLNRALEMRAEDSGVYGAAIPGGGCLGASCGANSAGHKGWGQAIGSPTYDPHAELRKTWKPGQRWQIKSKTWDVWVDHGDPDWDPGLEYRRHPDDIQEGSGNG